MQVKKSPVSKQFKKGKNPPFRLKSHDIFQTFLFRNDCYFHKICYYNTQKEHLGNLAPKSALSTKKSEENHLTEAKNSATFSEFRFCRKSHPLLPAGRAFAAETALQETTFESENAELSTIETGPSVILPEDTNPTEPPESVPETTSDSGLSGRKRRHPVLDGSRLS